MPARTPRPLTFGSLFASRSPLASGLGAAGCLSVALLAGCASSTSPAESAQGAPSCSLDAPQMNTYERLDRVSSFGPNGGYMGNPTVKPYQGFYALIRPPTQPREEPAGAAEFRLTAKPVVEQGEAFDLKLFLVNRSRQPLTLLRPSVGDELNSSAYYDIYARPEGEHRTYRFGYSHQVIHCGNRGPVEASEYVDVAPGQAAVLDDQQDERSDARPVRLFSPGRYVVWAVYRFCGISSASVDYNRLEALKGEFASNSVTIEVR
jgi:hypothetical protein